MRVCHQARQCNQKKLEEWLLQNLQIEAEKYNRMIRDQKKEAPKKTNEIAKINTKLEKIKDLYLNDLLSREQYEKDYLSLTAALKEAQEQEKIDSRKEINIDKFKEALESYHNLTEESKKAFWSRTIKQIILTEEGDFRVVFNTNQ